MNRPNAFTLVELLVVMTIIAVLLALLTPALDVAVYEAELVVCASRLDALAKGVTHYALDFRRQYPYRKGARTVDWWFPYLLHDAGLPTLMDPSFDLRRV